MRSKQNNDNQDLKTMYNLIDLTMTALRNYYDYNHKLLMQELIDGDGHNDRDVEDEEDVYDGDKSCIKVGEFYEASSRDIWLDVDLMKAAARIWKEMNPNQILKNSK